MHKYYYGSGIQPRTYSQKHYGAREKAEEIDYKPVLRGTAEIEN
jgi:hypothetical protein